MKRILIAEDDPDTAKLIGQLLEERLDVETVPVPSGALVMDTLAAATADLVILDVWLPGMNGLDVFDLMRASDHSRDVPVLVLTSSLERAREALDHQGVRDVFTKPFDTDVLVARVDALLTMAVPAA